uniref:Adhesion g protein-coupled receptor a3 n=1 Tax=Triatoma infestans TaxID=30076 RepID=A0A170X9M8_TRIIF
MTGLKMEHLVIWERSNDWICPIIELNLLRL